MIEAPIFEVIVHDGKSIADGHRYRIWADGRIEGFGDQAIVINHVRQHVNDCISAWNARALYDPKTVVMGRSLPIVGR